MGGALRRLAAATALLLVIPAGSAWAGAAWADTTGPNNSAVAVNQHDGSDLFRIAFSVRSMSGPTVSPTNSAIAYASCTSCETVAIAIQLIFVIGPANVVTPTNEAIAVNSQCTLCQTMASATQYIVMEPGPVHFTAAGERDLSLVRRQLHDLSSGDASVTQVQATITLVRSELARVISSEIVTGPADRGESDKDATASTTTPTSTQPPLPSTTSSTTGAATTSSTAPASPTTSPAATTSSSTSPTTSATAPT